MFPFSSISFHSQFHLLWQGFSILKVFIKSQLPHQCSLPLEILIHPKCRENFFYWKINPKDLFQWQTMHCFPILIWYDNIMKVYYQNILKVKDSQNKKTLNPWILLCFLPAFLVWGKTTNNVLVKTKEISGIFNVLPFSFVLGQSIQN